MSEASEIGNLHSYCWDNRMIWIIPDTIGIGDNCRLADTLKCCLLFHSYSNPVHFFEYFILLVTIITNLILEFIFQ